MRKPSKKVCSFDECELPQVAKGHCRTHYEQLRTGRELIPIGKCGARPLPSDTCASEGCDNARKVVSNGRSSRCVSCLSLWVGYRLTLEDAQSIWNQQGNKCACCPLRGPYVYIPGQQWHVDHDHSCCPRGASTCGKCVRGIVCHGCNTKRLTVDMTKEVWELTGVYLGYTKEPVEWGVGW